MEGRGRAGAACETNAHASKTAPTHGANDRTAFTRMVRPRLAELTYRSGSGRRIEHRQDIPTLSHWVLESRCRRPENAVSGAVNAESATQPSRSVSKVMHGGEFSGMAHGVAIGGDRGIYPDDAIRDRRA